MAERRLNILYKSNTRSHIYDKNALCDASGFAVKKGDVGAFSVALSLLQFVRKFAQRMFFYLGQAGVVAEESFSAIRIVQAFSGEKAQEERYDILSLPIFVLPFLLLVYFLFVCLLFFLFFVFCFVLFLNFCIWIV